LIGSIRRVSTDHIIVLDEVYLRRVLKSYATYFNVARTHRSLNKDSPSHAQFITRDTSYRTRSLADCPSILPNLSFRHTPERVRGEGDAERNAVFAAAFNRDQEFFAFYRTIQTYEKGFDADDTRAAQAGFRVFQYFRSRSDKPATAQASN
jgi:hypothetical protein